MEFKHCESCKSHDIDEGGERFAAKHLGGESRETMEGDVIWVEFCDGTWWPALVFDENAVSGSHKPSNRSPGDVLVRLYGSYEYLYVDPIKCRSEFEIALKQNNGCYGEIFRKALEQDLPHSQSGRSKGQGARAKGTSNGSVAASKNKKSSLKNKRVQKEHRHNGQNVVAEAKCQSRKQDGMQKRNKPNRPSTAHAEDKTPMKDATLSGRSQELNARRKKVMQSLGLIAPSGSPFH